ncbi:MAG: ATP-binding protein [Akkermansiaceae bacterium]|nr:ATP-binding protein [Akkermansiaceae bacterium]MCP5545126.1 ATP-binding protein [Akkermansiaceae bacterium]
MKARFLRIHAGGHPKWNSHPCGYYGDLKRQCRCSSRQIENYRQRISGPLLDRIDLHVEVPLVDFRELSSDGGSGETSATIRARVAEARNFQNSRFHKSSTRSNSTMTPRQVKQFCQLDSESSGYLEHAMEEMNFSARAHNRILKVARTLADLSGSESVRPADILEAIQFRSLERKSFSWAEPGHRSCCGDRAAFALAAEDEGPMLRVAPKPHPAA